MLRPNRKRLNRIGLVLIVVSIVLFSVSVALLMQSTNTYSNVYVAPGTSNHYYKAGVHAGDDIHYSIQQTSNGSVNVTAFLIAPDGAHYGNISLSPTTYSAVVVAPASGNWTLVITNNGNSQVNMTVKLGDIGYLNTFAVVFGFALLPSGLVLLAISAYSAAMEKRKKKKMDSLR